MTPEALARLEIDRLLAAAGWVVQDYEQIALGAGLGVAVREFPLKQGRTTIYADYLLFVDRRAAGVIEAKPQGFTLTGVEGQAERYSEGLPEVPPTWRRPLPFLYLSTGQETRFTDGRDPEPRSRPLFAFHQPETLATWLKDDGELSLRARLQGMPPLVSGRLWPVQAETIQRLEASLAAGRPRALIHMATGSGKTFTAVSAAYRLIKHARAQRILFLVDRTNLGQQAYNEFGQYETPDDGRKFTELYPVQRLAGPTLDPSSKVVISTIQRLYAILSGAPEEVDDEEERSLWEEADPFEVEPKLVQYNPQVPIEFFDVIIIDECHRSIYHLWRQVLDYFDAFLVGLTATPAQHTYAFFHQNLVQEYGRAQAVADGINVDGIVYRIRTRITEKGAEIERGRVVEKRDRLTRARRWEQLDEELAYSGGDLDQSVVNPSQIRMVIRSLREALQELFPGREMVPKTLIFAKDDQHAERITEIVREEFERGNEFCQKITYRSTGKSAAELISAFRNSPMPRVAVTVDMIATGTDIKALEVLVFLRRVRSAVLFEQMLGRGTRVIAPESLQGVSGVSAHRKDFFVIVDAVGVVEHPRVDVQSMERVPSVAFDKLLQRVAQGAWDEDTLLTLAGRLGRLARQVSATDEAAIRAVGEGQGPGELARTFLAALDPDEVLARAQATTGERDPAPDALAAAGEALRGEAAILLADNPALRQALAQAHARNEVVVDVYNVDEVLEAGFSAEDTALARETVQQFEAFLAKNRDRVEALQLLYSQPYRQRELTYSHIQALAERLAATARHWTPQQLWHAYARVEGERVRGRAAERVLTDLVALVRHALEPEAPLVPFAESVQARYQAWLAAQQAAGQPFTAEQRRWLDAIAQQVAVDLRLTPTDIDHIFYSEGGRIAARRVLGEAWQAILSDLNDALIA